MTTDAKPVRPYVQKGWTYGDGEGCEHKIFNRYDPNNRGDCPWRWKVKRHGVRYCGVHDPVAREKRHREMWGDG
jgi:hypothetical protein